MEKDLAIEEMQTLKSEISAMEGQIKNLEEALGQAEAKVAFSSNKCSCAGWAGIQVIMHVAAFMLCSDDCVTIRSETTETWLSSHLLRLTFIK